MFNMEDFDNIKSNKNKKKHRRYEQDETEFFNQIMIVTKVMKDTNFTEHKDRTAFIMHMMNMSIDDSGEINEKSLDLISVLCSHICMMMIVIDNDKDMYFYNYDKSMLNQTGSPPEESY